MVEVFMRPEQSTGPTDPLAAARFKGVQVKHELLYETDNRSRVRK